MAQRHILSLLGCMLAAGGAMAQPAKPAVESTPYVIPAPPPPLPSVVQLPSPANPLAGVTLPADRSGDGAYQGGGVVLEQDGRGVTRQLR